MSRALALLLGSALCLAAQEPPKAESAPLAPPVQAPLPAVTPAPPTAPDTQATAIQAQKSAGPKAPLLDDGLLDPSWFGDGITFTEGDDMDFFWMKPGLDLSGHTVFMKPWEHPAMLRKGRNGKDNAKAAELTDRFPGILRGALTGAFNGKVQMSRTEGDLALVGRFVDVNAGSAAARFLIGVGAGSETATWDLKIVDSKTGDLLLAVHHRAISGTVMAGTTTRSSIQGKLGKWANRFATFAAARALR